MSKLIIGRHIGTTPNFINCVNHAKELGCLCMQIFLGSPHQISSKKKSDESLSIVKNDLIKNNMIMVIHGSYTINLCNINTLKTSIKSIMQDLVGCNTLGALGVIIHMGKNIDKINEIDAINNYINGLKIICKEMENLNIKCKLILETGAGQGNEIGTKLEKLSIIWNGLSKDEKKYIGFCIDTCHIWASGYDISNENGVDNYFKLFNKLIGTEHILCIHFNNSQNPCNSHVDRHADINNGMINVDGLKEVANYAISNHVPLIMETPLTSIDATDEINYVKKLMK